MHINPDVIVSLTDANQNFSKVAKIVEKYGQAIIFENNKPRFVVIDIESNPDFNMSDDERIDVAAKKILEKYRKALKELAK